MVKLSDLTTLKYRIGNAAAAATESCTSSDLLTWRSEMTLTPDSPALTVECTAPLQKAPAVQKHKNQLNYKSLSPSVCPGFVDTESLSAPIWAQVKRPLSALCLRLINIFSRMRNMSGTFICYINLTESESPVFPWEPTGLFVFIQSKKHRRLSFILKHGHARGCGGINWVGGGKSALIKPPWFDLCLVRTFWFDPRWFWCGLIQVNQC